MSGRKLVYLGECVRCKGDLCRSRDFYGEYMQCMQCGYVIDVEEELDVGGYLAGKVRSEAA